MVEKPFVVYKHTSPTGKVYIGITRQEPKKRWGNGSNYASNKHFSNAISLHGWNNFKHEVLYSNLSEQEAKLKEIELIALYDSTNPNKGYNITLGGESGFGRHHTQRAKQKISDAMKGNENKDEYGCVDAGVGLIFDEKMSRWCGKTMTILNVYQTYYTMEEDYLPQFYWRDEMIECKVEE